MWNLFRESAAPWASSDGADDENHKDSPFAEWPIACVTERSSARNMKVQMVAKR